MGIELSVECCGVISLLVLLLDSFHMQCQRYILHISWYDLS